MLSYELCNKLKKAGFPQKTHNPMHYATVHGQEYVVCDCGPSWVSSEHIEYLVAPTLSELIEACGDRFGHLQKNYKRPWATFSVLEEACLGYGDTPEESVANLYLVLKESKQ